MTSEAIPELQEAPATYRKHNASQCSPELREQIIKGLKQRIGVIKLATLLGCSQHTVQAVRDETPGLPDWKENISGKLKQFVHLVADDLIENYDTIKPESKPIALAVAIDKILLLDGEPTQIVENRVSFDLTGLTGPSAVREEIVVEAVTADYVDTQSLPGSTVHQSIPSSLQSSQAPDTQSLPQ